MPTTARSIENGLETVITRAAPTSSCQNEVSTARGMFTAALTAAAAEATRAVRQRAATGEDGALTGLA